MGIKKVYWEEEKIGYVKTKIFITLTVIKILVFMYVYICLYNLPHKYIYI